MRSSLVAICFVLAGCATAPFTGTHSTRERLDVVTEKGPSSKSRPIPLYRDGWVKAGKIGGWLFGAGVALLGGGGGTLIGVGVMESQNWRQRTPTLTIASLIAAGVGLASAIAGGSMIWTANDHIQDHVLTYEQAVDAANQYNVKNEASH